MADARNYDVMKDPGGSPIKAWVQLRRIAQLPFVHRHVAVMHAQRDLVDIVHTLRQVVCVKG